jgi:quercetin dioxygenase-like cupin family protein
MNMILAAVLFLQILPANPVLDNDFVRVDRNSAPCASGSASCGERVVVALGPIEVGGQKMERGNIKVFKTGERYAAPKSGDYLEMVIKPGHPKVMAPKAGTPPEPGNKILYDGNDFFISQEKMEPGETSTNHSHNTRVAIYLNKTRVQQWTDGKEETRDLEPDVVVFRPPVVHISKDVGKIPINNLLIEFKP